MIDDVNFVLLERVLDEATLRHRVIAHNMANVNTPGFHRREVHFADHLAAAVAAGDADAIRSAQLEVQQANDPPLRPDGNNVSLEREMGDMMKNSVVYNAVTQLISARIAGYRSAITGSSGS
jgi:flagellar basal-body rod protein FlgB